MMMSIRSADCSRSTLPTTGSIRRKRLCHFSYRFQSIHSKEALLVLFWDILIGIAQNAMVYSASDVQDAYSDFVFTLIVWFTLPIAFLVAGFVGDALITRYNIIYVGSWLSLVCMISLYLIIVLELPSLLAYIVYALLLVTLASVRVNLLPFNIDQLIGSSSDELSAVIHWHNIGPIFALISSQIVELNIDNVPRIYYIVVSVPCVAALLISHSFCKHWLDCTPVNTTNPVKLIVQVFCYARKHKHPENRSAFTYWVENAPLRLDLGKEIYGGPFTEEAVEGIKTILRLLPLTLICGIPISLVEEYVLGVGANNYGCDTGSIYVMSFTMTYLAVIILYQFLIFPCCHKYIPSMLRRIGLGLLLVVIINVALVVLVLVGQFAGTKELQCLITLDLVEYLQGFPVTWNLGLLVFNVYMWYIRSVTVFEFILAQCPKSMRGTIVGLWFLFRVIRQFINFAIFLPFHHYISSDVYLGRGFYFFLTRAILCLLFCIFFAVFSKQYKLRGENIINIHQIVEDCVIHDIEQKEEEEERRRRRNQEEDSSGLHTMSNLESLDFSASY